MQTGISAGRRARRVGHARRLAASVVAMSVGGTVVAGVGGVAAAAGPCPEGAKHLGDGVCQTTFTATPAGTWTAPAGATRLEALLVGAGASNFGGYAGGGGEVRVVSLDPAETYTISVANGVDLGKGMKMPTVVDDGTAPEVAMSACGGYPDFTCASGNGNAGYLISVSHASGGGAGGVATDADGGSGVVVDDIAGPGSLFDGMQTCYGGGGPTAIGTGSDVLFGTATCGAGAWSFVGGLLSYAPVRANSGGGAGGYVINEAPGGAPSFAPGNGGGHGIVILRYQVASAERTIFTVLDRSGSMLAEKRAVVADYNAALARWQRVSPGSAYYLTVFDASGTRRWIVDREIDRVRPLTAARLGGGGDTPLYDTVAAQIGRLRKIDPSGKVTFAIVTDGEDTASTTWTEARLAALIRRTVDREGWRFQYIGASLASLEAAVAARD